MSAARARIAGLPPVAITATLNDVHLTHLTSLEGAIGSLRVDARVGAGGVRELLASPSCTAALPADLRGALTVAPRVLLFPGRIDLLPPTGRSAEIRLRPVTRNGGLAFAVLAIERAGVRVVGERGERAAAVRAAARQPAVRRERCVGGGRPPGRSTFGCARPARRSPRWGSAGASLGGVPSRLPNSSRPHAARGPLRSRPPGSRLSARDEHGPRSSPARVPAVLRFTRHGVPALAVLAGIISMAFGTSTSLAGGAAPDRRRPRDLVASWLYRVGVQGDGARAEEERARRYFDRHGRWPSR